MSSSGLPSRSSSQRLPTPDVARGGMLLLIALANVPLWVHTVALTNTRGGDRVVVVLQDLLIDQRIYPLFSILVGFGIATLAARSNSTRLIVRRGLVLLAVGALHGLLFPGDVLGAYGLTIALLGALVVSYVRGGSWIPLTLVACLVATLQILSVLLADAMTALDDGTFKTLMAPEITEFRLTNLAEWAGNTVFTLPATAVVPCFVIGVFVWRGGLLAEPQRHRPLLAAVTVLGLGASAALGWPAVAAALSGSDSAGALDTLVGADVPVPITLNTLGGYAGGLGWLALMALGSSWLPTHEVATRPSSPRYALAWLLVAVGRRSMSAYLLQTVVFFAVFDIGFGAAQPAVTLAPLPLAGIAVATWLVIAAAAAVLQNRGLPGPAEKATRTMIYRGVPR